MTGATHPKMLVNRLRLEGLGLFIGLISLIVLVVIIATGPVRELRTEIDAVEARMAGFAVSVSETAPVQRIDLSDIVAFDGEAGLQSASLQREIVADAESAGLYLQQLSPADTDPLGEGLISISFTLDAQGDLEAWTGFLTRLAARRPAVFIERMRVNAGGVQRFDEQLAINLVVEAYMAGGNHP